MASQPPGKPRSKPTNPQKPERTDIEKKESRADSFRVVVVMAINRIINKLFADVERREKQERERNFNEKRSLYILSATVVFTAITAVILWFTMYFDQRAYVVTDIKVESVDDRGGVRVTIPFKNTGKTPTVGLRWAGYPIDNPQLESGKIVSFRNKAVTQRVLIGPEADAAYPFVTAFDRHIKDMMNVKGSHYAPKFGGEIIYKDIFGGHHKTLFCYTLYDSSGANDPKTYGVRSCGDNTNCADKECKEK